MELMIAVDREFAIGLDGDMLIHIKDDLKRFRSLTLGEVVIMGHGTFKSLPEKKPLDGRINIVISRDENLKIEGAEVVNNIEELFKTLKKYEDKKHFVIGGGFTTRLLLPYIDFVYLTYIDKTFSKHDTTIPNLFRTGEFEIKNISDDIKSDGVTYRYIELKRIKPALKTLQQPEIIEIENGLRLRKFDGIYDFAKEWYKDTYIVKMVDGDETPYDDKTLKNMYTWQDMNYELYFIEIFENGKFIPIGDVAFGPDDMPMVIGNKKYRGCGIGKKVLKALINRAKNLGYEEIFVGEIYDFNENSKKCYTSVGFVPFEKTKKGMSYRLDLLKQMEKDMKNLNYDELN